MDDTVLGKVFRSVLSKEKDNLVMGSVKKSSEQGGAFDFSTTLLREKFVIRDSAPFSDEAPVVALSNRMVIRTLPEDLRFCETFVLRAQNMHSCIRMGASLMQTTQAQGPVVNRPVAYEWSEQWGLIGRDYEQRHNPQAWIGVYHEGKLLYGEGQRHSFLDIIETCQKHNQNNYEEALVLAERAFQRAGKMVNIEYDSNIALVMNINAQQARCGIILRGADKTRTFNFTVRQAMTPAQIPRYLNICAAFLEGIQLAFQIGAGQAKLHQGLIARTSDEARKIKASEDRMHQLIALIYTFEKNTEIHFRPDRPNLLKIMAEAESATRRYLSRS